MMSDNNKLALISAYYLSRFDREAVADLGYSSFNEAARSIGKILSVKPKTIQNMRDEFDPYHNNKRAGWYQRTLAGSRKKVVRAFQDLDKHSLQDIHGHGGTYRYYRCTKRLGPCSQKYVQEKELAEQIKTNLQTVAISDDWHSQGLAQIEQWEKELKNNNASFVQNLEIKTQENDQKLNKLVDSYLDGTIEKEIYLVKKEELIKQKTDFNRKKSDFGRKGISWIKPMRTFWKAAHQAKKLAVSNDFNEIKSFVAEHGTNRRLGGRKVSWLWVGGFKIVGGYAENAAVRLADHNFYSLEKSDCFTLSG
ncbi:MAG: hypothetical protein HY569_02035 [Candidatus Magasanikbacteria bacterium]|nr:hypothetical protein [Candidatus Magasanikbacteria bacterium]